MYIAIAENILDLITLIGFYLIRRRLLDDLLPQTADICPRTALVRDPFLEALDKT
jgi:hypothetical protein